MNTVFEILVQIRAVLRPAIFWLAIIAAVIFALDWAVRTRRINPFGPIGQFMRKYIDPIVAPVERKIVRAGGMPSAAPWWTLVAVVIGGILLLWALEFLIRTVWQMQAYGAMGAAGLLVMLVAWLFSILQLAIIIRVIASWVGFSVYSKWLRWTVTISEPILHPLRQIIPTFGMIDITPMVAILLLSVLRSLII